MTSKNLLDFQDKIFVAGHRGMAGSAICRALKLNGFNNVVTVSRDTVDLLDFKAVDTWFKDSKPSVVVVAAAKVGGIHANSSYPANFLLDNLKIQNNVIECAWKSGVRRLLFLGSSCIYPKFANQPITEEALLTNSLESTNQWYAIAKIAGIKLCHALRLQYGFDAISLMPTNLYGQGDNYHSFNSHVLPALIRRFYEASRSGEQSVTCWGSGSPLREFLHVDDLADASVFALNKWSPSSDDAPSDKNGEPLQFLNVGTGNEISIKELAESISSKFDFKGEIIWDTSKPDGTPKKVLDVSRLNALGWQSKISLNEGLNLTINSFRDYIGQGLIRL